jgi:LysR family glycine cleavage system transcriptional activator
MGSERSRLPSLTALRVFEAAARHLSFTRAAADLHVTQAAVSRQVRLLESELGKPLFVRLYRCVELTAAGKHLADELARSFASIHRVVDDVRGVSRQSIKLGVEPAFAARWLIPRLPRFQVAHTDVDIEIESSDALQEVGRDVDLAIRYLNGPLRKPGRSAELLVEVEGFPVLAPSLKRGRGVLKQPRDLLVYPLLHEDDGTYWAQWFAAAGLGPVAVKQHLRFNDAALVLQATADGQGIALGDELLAGEDLRAGRLLRPFELETRCGSYWLLWHRAMPNKGALRNFRDWLHHELANRRAGVR